MLVCGVHVMEHAACADPREGQLQVCNQAYGYTLACKAVRRKVLSTRMLSQECFAQVDEDTTTMIRILGRLRQALQAQGVQVGQTDRSICRGACVLHRKMECCRLIAFNMWLQAQVPPQNQHTPDEMTASVDYPKLATQALNSAQVAPAAKAAIRRQLADMNAAATLLSSSRPAQADAAHDTEILFHSTPKPGVLDTPNGNNKIPQESQLPLQNADPVTSNQNGTIDHPSMSAQQQASKQHKHSSTEQPGIAAADASSHQQQGQQPQACSTPGQAGGASHQQQNHISHQSSPAQNGSGTHRGQHVQSPSSSGIEHAMKPQI